MKLLEEALLTVEPTSKPLNSTTSTTTNNKKQNNNIINSKQKSIPKESTRSKQL